MGACYSNNANTNLKSKNLKEAQSQVNEQPIIVKINVIDVKVIPEEDKEKFKNTYISDIYLHGGEEEFEIRNKIKSELMWKRWDWLQGNKEIYVNMLREKGFTDENIQDCLDGKRPLCFSSKELHDEFCKDLGELRVALEAELGFKNVRYVQAGSSVPGYSSNPFKGFADKPSKITDIGKSDVDVVIIAEGVKSLVEAKRKEGAKVREYPTVTSRSASEDIRYGLNGSEIAKSSKSLNEWMEKWAKKMGGGVQVTFQEHGAVAPPWELPILVPKRA